MLQNLTKHIWLPYTQMKKSVAPLQAASTQGSRVTLQDGRALIDGTSSWWTACHGYNHPHIADAVTKQLEQMPHIMFGGMVHEPALKLAERLAKLTPGDLDHVFFSDSGSVAVEVALKMAVQYWLNKGVKGRTKFISFRHGYHGDTMACMSLCDPIEGMHAHFKGWLPEQIMADLPVKAAELSPVSSHPRRRVSHLVSNDLKENGIPACAGMTAESLIHSPETSSDVEFNALLEKEKHRVTAVIIEPLVQGAGGMKFHDAATLKRVADMCAKHGVLLIADEVFTGFGRTGTMFACEQAGIVPDIMCLGKALTGGTMTLAATCARKHIFDAFWSDDPNHALMHGPTYMANPLACAAANASLDLFENEPRLEQVRKIETLLREGLESCRNLPGVKDVRVKGAIGVVQMDRPVDSTVLKKEFVDRGVWIRPFGDIIYLTPAFTIGEGELGQLMVAIFEVVKNRYRDLS